jgi:hypothetical protein
MALANLNALILDVPVLPDRAEQRELSVVLEGGGPVAADVEPPFVTLRRLP